MAPMGPAGAHARGGDVFGAPRKHVYIDIFIYIYIYITMWQQNVTKL